MTDVEFAEISNRAIQVLSGVVYGPAALITAVLKPTPADYEEVFVGNGPAIAANAYAPFWANPPQQLARSMNSQIRLFARRSQDIVASNEFPGGYSKIAHLLAPDQIWFRFKLIANGGADVLAYDGLVARGERWAWFPKPWRMLNDGGN